MDGYSVGSLTSTNTIIERTKQSTDEQTTMGVLKSTEYCRRHSMPGSNVIKLDERTITKCWSDGASLPDRRAACGAGHNGESEVLCRRSLDGRVPGLRVQAHALHREYRHLCNNTTWLHTKPVTATL